MSAACRSRASRKRADAAQKLAMEKAEAAGLELCTDAAGNPKPQALRNHSFAEACGYTAPDSHTLKGADGWIQGYNCQAAIESDHQVIVAIGVSNQPSDTVYLLPMLERIQSITGQLPDAFNADAGYCSTANLEAFEDRGLNAYISTSRQQHGQRPLSDDNLMSGRANLVDRSGGVQLNPVAMRRASVHACSPHRSTDCAVHVQTTNRQSPAGGCCGGSLNDLVRNTANQVKIGWDRSAFQHRKGAIPPT